MIMARSGWSQKAREIAEISRPYYKKLSNSMVRETMSYDFEGIGIDVARYVDGIPECMQKFTEKIVTGKSSRVINMIVNVGATRDVKADTMVQRGVFAFTLMSLLELSGYRVSVTLVSHAETDRNRKTITVKTIVKAADQPSDNARLAYIMAHPSVLRRLIFSIREHSQNVAISKSRSLEYSVPPGSIYIPNGNSFNGMSKDGIEDRLILELGKYGISVTKNLKK